MYVVITKLIFECVAPHLNGSLVPEQYGTKGKAATQQAMLLLQDELHPSEGAYALFIDVAKAFPSVPHTVLLHMLQRRGVPGHVLAMLHDIYTQSITTYPATSFDYRVSRGFKEGCPMSPTLFVFYYDVDLSKLKERLSGASVSAYMDDVALGGQRRAGRTSSHAGNTRYRVSAGF